MLEAGHRLPGGPTLAGMLASSRITVALVAVLTVTMYVPASTGAGSGLAPAGTEAGAEAGPIGPTLSPAPTSTPQSTHDAVDPDCAVPGVDDKCEDWVTNPEESFGSREVAVSPDSALVFREGAHGPVSAHDADTGERLWTPSYPADYFVAENTTGQYDRAFAVTPDGRLVLDVLEGRDNDERELFYHLVAFNATTGERAWIAPRVESSLDRTIPYGIDVGPGSQAAYVTGNAGTVAYDLSDGTVLWSTDAGSTGSISYAGGVEVAAGPHGESVYVAQEVRTGPHRVITLDASTGEVEWTAPVSNPGPTDVYSASLSPDGDTFVLSSGSFTVDGYVAAFDTETGQLAWDAHIVSIVGTDYIPWSSAVSPDSSTVYAAASQRGELGTLGTEEIASSEAFVIAFDAETGETHWIHREPGRHMFGLHSLAAGPDGEHLYVNSASHFAKTWRFRSSFVTQSLDAKTGTTEWRALYGKNLDRPSSVFPGDIAVAPDGTHVYSSPANIAGFPVGGYSESAYDTVNEMAGSPAPAFPLPRGFSDLLAYETGGADTAVDARTGGSLS